MHRTAAVCLALVLCSAAQAQGRPNPSETADQKELYNYVLTMDKIQRLGAATRDLQDLIKRHPELNALGGDPKSLNETVQRFQKVPDAATIVSKNGFTPREYVLGFMCVLQSTMAVGFKKAGTFKEYPPDLLKQVSKANLDFVEQHYDEARKIMGSAAQQ